MIMIMPAFLAFLKMVLNGRPLQFWHAGVISVMYSGKDIDSLVLLSIEQHSLSLRPRSERKSQLQLDRMNTVTPQVRILPA